MTGSGPERVLEDACPRCGAPRSPGQEYCLACGLRLPPTSGRGPRLRRTWVRRIGWYPGDWVWTTLLALVVAAAAAAVAIVTTHKANSNTGTTFVYTSPSVPVTTPAPTRSTSVAATTPPAPPEPTTARETTSTAAKAPPANGKTVWPARSGWTVVLVSLPATAAGNDRAQAQARHAVRAGLPEVGVLASARYTSLHPGYFVVFSGVYDSRSQAESTLAAAHSGGFPGAYVREIVP